LKISEILKTGPSYSFEFFPPRDEKMEGVLAQTLRELEPLGPSYVSVTYGAGGTTRERTHDLVVGIDRDTSMTAMAHLTCAAHTRAELVEIVTRYRDAGVDNILALGGDPPKDLDLPPGELHYAVELVRLIREVGDFSVGVAAHPEPHPRSPSRESDRRHGVDKPVIAGIMPATGLGSIKRMSEMQGSEFPQWLADKLRAVGDDPAEVRRVGIAEATKLCAALLEGGAPGLHFYTLNRSTATREIYENLNLGAR
jgi:methylenetetrahydrofolate reductase (NADPH)